MSSYAAIGALALYLSLVPSAASTKSVAKTALAHLDQMNGAILQHQRGSGELPLDIGHLGILVRLHAQVFAALRAAKRVSR